MIPIFHQDTSKITEATEILQEKVDGLQQTVEGLQQTVKRVQQAVQAMSLKFDELVSFLKNSSRQETQPEETSTTHTPISTEDELQKMEDNLMMFDRNILHDEEFKNQRQKLVR